MTRHFVIREHESIDEIGFSSDELAELNKFTRSVLKSIDGKLASNNYVGVLTTRKGSVLEILPKIDLSPHAEGSVERTRQVFLEMMRTYRRSPKEMQFSDVRSLARFPMLEVFVHQFLLSLGTLFRSGLARKYINVEENRSYFRGRILFADQIRENITNRTRFYSEDDELSTNRPANRLIHTALDRLKNQVKDPHNQQIVRQFLISIADVPKASDLRSDWKKHHIDRTMRHYGPVMQWIRLFLFQEGLATYAGQNTNISLLFNMEQVFEDFLISSFRKYQQQYSVIAQGPQKALTTIDDERAFFTKPDIALKNKNLVTYILDAKWKSIDGKSNDVKHGISQEDVYQLHAYATLHKCKAVALLYPKNARFQSPIRYRFFDKIRLIAIPFDVENPQQSVCLTLHELQSNQE